jgi:hypothetical protein
VEPFLSQEQFVSFRAGLFEQIHAIEVRLLSIEQVCNGFKWRERILGGVAVFLIGVVMSQGVNLLDKRDETLRLAERQAVIREKQNEFNVKFESLERKLQKISGMLEGMVGGRLNDIKRERPMP